MASREEQACEAFRVLAQPVRLRLVLALCRGEACPRDLAAFVGRPVPYVSQQLAVLRRAGLVACRREGPHVCYRMAAPQLCAMLAAMQLTQEPSPARGHPIQERY